MGTTKKERNPANKGVLNTERHQTRFLEAYAESANISAAAKSARINRKYHYEWLRDDPEYAARFAAAHEQACDLIDEEIRRRGVTGVLEPVFYQGKKVSAVRRYDSTLLIFFAKGLMPEKYRDNYKADITTHGTLDVHATHNIDLTKLTNEQLDQLEAMFQLDSDGSESPGL